MFEGWLCCVQEERQGKMVFVSFFVATTETNRSHLQLPLTSLQLNHKSLQHKHSCYYYEVLQPDRSTPWKSTPRAT